MGKNWLPWQKKMLMLSGSLAEWISSEGKWILPCSPSNKPLSLPQWEILWCRRSSMTRERLTKIKMCESHGILSQLKTYSKRQWGKMECVNTLRIGSRDGWRISLPNPVFLPRQPSLLNEWEPAPELSGSRGLCDRSSWNRCTLALPHRCGRNYTRPEGEAHW